MINTNKKNYVNITKINAYMKYSEVLCGIASTVTITI